ncbi:MAG TPA: TonB family protein [Terriglobales bacterium]|nr:TonB family protein [Terriglobales bacterium]
MNYFVPLALVFMTNGLGFGKSVVTPPAHPVSPPRLLIELEPWGKVFAGNLAESIRAGRRERFNVEAADFWPDVFVSQKLPWRRIFESGIGHVTALAVVLWLIQIWPHPIEARARIPFDASEVIYYPVSEYLPPIDSGTHPAKAQSGDPEYAKQPILSVPPEADNHKQTVITPPQVKLDHEVALPNIVAWSPTNLPVPMAATARPAGDLTMPTLPTTAVPPAPDVKPTLQRELPGMASEVIAPTPDVGRTSERRVPVMQAGAVAPAPAIGGAGRTPGLAELRTEVVAPAPNLFNTTSRRIADITIGHSPVVAPAPQLPMSEQRAISGYGGGALSYGTVVAPTPEVPLSARAVSGSRRGASGVGFDQGTVVAPTPDLSAASQRGAWRLHGTESLGAQVVPPPPSLGGTATATSSGRVIALSIHPADVKGPIQIAQGNRRGSFSAIPEGKPGAAGTPSVSASAGAAAAGAGTGHGRGEGNGNAPIAGVPPGIHVGAGPSSANAAMAGESGNASSNNTVAFNLLATLTPPPRVSVPETHGAAPVDPARASEVERKVFGVKRFYSMTANMPNLNSSGGSWIIRFAELKETKQAGDLVAPVATQKVDPAYPIELMRQNVQGTVTLYAVIHSDGSVGDVKVLSSIDERLDEYARTALARWRFRPATRDGNPVAIEALVMIPFRVSRTKF